MATNESAREAFKKIVQNMPDEDFEDFFYTMGRIAEKSGYMAFFDALDAAATCK